MSLRIRYSDPRGIDEPAVMTSLGSNIRYGDLQLTQSAEQGNPSMSTVTIEDPGAAWTFNGLRALEFAETSAASNNQIIGRFAIADRTVRRSREHALITGTDREWAVDLVDYNWHGGKRVLVDSDSNRPAETAGDRIRWLLRSAANINLNDYGNVTYPSQALDGADYRGQRAIDVLNDCTIEGGYMWWVEFNEAHGRPELFVINPDAATYPASVAISNVASDVDGVTTFYPSEDATLRRSASRLAYGVYLAYSNGSVYVRNDAVAQQYGALDQTAPMSNVKSASRARRVATKFLNDNADEADVISCAITLPAAQVNDVRHGQVIPVRFQHLPGYETSTACRVIRRTVTQDESAGQDWYRVALEMVPGGTAPFTGPAFAAILRAGLYGTTTLAYQDTGDSPTAGWYIEPKVGPLSYTDAGWPRNSITATSAMTCRVEAAAYVSGVEVVPTAFTLSVSINRGGSTIAVGSDSYTSPTGVYYEHRLLVDVYGVQLEAGDIVTVSGTPRSQWGNVLTNLSYLRVGRGTHTWNTGAVTWTGY